MDEPHPALAWFLIICCLALLGTGSEAAMYLGFFGGIGIIAASWRVLLSSLFAPARFVISIPKKRARERAAREHQSELERTEREKLRQEQSEAAEARRILDDVRRSLDDL